MIRVALAGNPNSGKTTLFNRLTGLHQTVSNYPGVTVEKKEGVTRDRMFYLVDLPGMYSLSAYSPEEELARETVLAERPDVLIQVLDGTNLARNLALTIELMGFGLPVVAAVNMIDAVTASGGRLDCDALSAAFGIPFVPISARTGENLDHLLAVAARADLPTPGPEQIYGPTAMRCIREIEELIFRECRKADMPVFWTAIALLEQDKKVWTRLRLPEQKSQKIFRIAEDLEQSAAWGDRETILAAERYRFIDEILPLVYDPGERSDRPTLSDQIDRILTDRLLALPAFIAILAAIFYLTFGPSGAALSRAVRILLEQLIHPWAEASLLRAGAQEWFSSLILEGLLEGVGGVLTFLPQILLLFFFLSLLEDSGYMARAAFLFDRIFRRFGLSGKSFVPLLLGFGCSVPAIMAARTLERTRDRRLTILLTPFMSCGARWPVYALFISAFFSESPWVVAAGIYGLGIFAAAVSGLLLKNNVFKGEPLPFVLEMPPYRLPTLEGVLLRIWDRSAEFLARAGSLILMMSVVLWFLSNHNLRLQMVPTGMSLLAAFGKRLAPLFVPLGFGQWEAAVSLLSGLLAKEAVVASLGMLVPLLQTFFTPASALSFMSFVLLYTPCISALAASFREMKSVRWAIFAVLWQSGTAYGFSFLVYRLALFFLNP